MLAIKKEVSGNRRERLGFYMSVNVLQFYDTVVGKGVTVGGVGEGGRGLSCCVCRVHTCLAVETKKEKITQSHN